VISFSGDAGPMIEKIDQAIAAIDRLAAAMTVPQRISIAEWLRGISAEELAAAVSGRASMKKDPWQLALDVLAEWANV
jgi:hypothetical protein